MRSSTELTELERRIGRALASPLVSECLSVEALIDLAELGSRSADFDRRMDHVVRCRPCRETLRELKRVEAERPRFVRALEWVASLAKWNLRRLEGRLFEGEHPVPQWTASYLRKLAIAPAAAGTYRSISAREQTVRLVQPSVTNVALTETSPRLSWEPVPGASGYHVRLEVSARNYDSAGETIEGVFEIEGASAQPKPGFELQPGREYRLVIRPITIAPGVIPSTIQQESSFYFRTLTRTQSREAKWARTNAAAAPLTAAIVLFRLGLLEEAAQLLDRWPNHSDAAAWAANIRHAIQARQADPSRPTFVA